MTIAAFDFDGTLTTKDTLFDFLIFSFGKQKLYKALIKLLPVMVLYKIGVQSNQVAKQKLFGHFFAGMPASVYYKLCNNYSARINEIINTKALNKLQVHKQQQSTVIIISASIEDWINPWANQNDIDVVLATKIEILNNEVTGRFITNNCYGIEKVNRLLAAFPEKEKYKLYAYGDSNGDKELLAFADVGYYRTF